MKANGTDEARFALFETLEGGWGVHLLATNGESIATGEIYASKSNATRAVLRLTEILAGDVHEVRAP